MWFVCLTEGCGTKLQLLRARRSGFCAVCTRRRAPSWPRALQLLQWTSPAYRMSQTVLNEDAAKVPEGVRCAHCGDDRQLEDDGNAWYCGVCARRTPKDPPVTPPCPPS